MSEKEPQQLAAKLIKVLDTAGSTSVDMLNILMAETIGMAMQNAVSAQQNAQIVNSAIVSATCSRILSVKSKPALQEKVVPSKNTANGIAETNHKNPAKSTVKKIA